MRNRVSAVFVVVFALSACSTEPISAGDSTEGPQIRSAGVLTAVVDDSSWISNLLEVRHGDGMLWITATAFGIRDEDRQHLRLTLEIGRGSTPQVIGPGTRRAASLTRDFVAGWLAEDSIGSGTIRLTSLTNDRAIGTFSFVGVTTSAVPPRQKVVRDGTFNVRLR